jgi:hypothetical protein
MYVFSIGHPFFLFYMFWNTCERNEIHSLENCHVKILGLESESENDKKCLDPNPKKNEFGFTIPVLLINYMLILMNEHYTDPDTALLILIITN